MISSQRTVPSPSADLDAADAADRLVAAFHACHIGLFTFRDDGNDVEIMTWRDASLPDSAPDGSRIHFKVRGSVTGDDGEFVIEGVPPGNYRIKMWHEGVALKQNIKSLQRYEYEQPYETTQDVTVEANGEAVVNFDLVLRSGT